MNTSFWEKRIPTIVGIILIGVGIGTITYLTGHRVLFLGNAAPSEVPRNVQVTNITDTSFTVTYITQAQVIGSISYGIDKNTPQLALDDRDQPTGSPSLHSVHSIGIKNLKPQTTYYFSIKSGEGNYLNNTLLYQVSTAPQINTPPTSEKPLTGKVLSSTGDPPSEALVFVKTSSSQLLSSLVKTTGFFIIPLNTLRTSDLNSYAPMNEGTSVSISATTDTATSRVTFTLGGENAVPSITLSQNYDFTLTSPTPVSAASHLASLPVSVASASGSTVITSPKDNAGLVDAQPEIQGTAPPNTTVDIEIHSPDIVKASVSTDSNGFWSFRPQTALSPGLHTLTATFRNASGIIKTITQSFTVYAQGSQVNQSATPSATPIVTATPTQMVTITQAPTTTLTPQPTLTQMITQGPTVAITISPTPRVTSTLVTPTPTPQFITGSETIPWVGVLGVASGVVGMVLFFATLGTSL